MVFNDHIATAEQALIDAVDFIADPANSGGLGINDLVLDIRYNGGGFLAIASQFAYMIAGAGQTAGQTFELLQFNDKNPATNPVTWQPISPTPFLCASSQIASKDLLPFFLLAVAMVLFWEFHSGQRSSEPSFLRYSPGNQLETQ